MSITIKPQKNFLQKIMMKMFGINVKKLFLKNIMIILQILNGLKKKQRVIVTI